MSKYVKRVQRRVYRAILEALADDAPDLYEELVELRRSNPQQYRKEIRLLVMNGYEGGTFDEYEPLFVNDGSELEQSAARNAATEQLLTQAGAATTQAKALKAKKKAKKKKPAAKAKKED